MSKATVIEAIKEKVNRLVADNRRLRDEFEKVTQQRDRLKTENRDLAQQIDRLEQRIKVLELRESLTGDSKDAKIARARVNRLMREVDKCIALLNR